MGSKIPILLLDRKLRDVMDTGDFFGGTCPWLMP